MHKSWKAINLDINKHIELIMFLETNSRFCKNVPISNISILYIPKHCKIAPKKYCMHLEDHNWHNYAPNEILNRKTKFLICFPILEVACQVNMHPTRIMLHEGKTQEFKRACQDPTLPFYIFKSLSNRPSSNLSNMINETNKNIGITAKKIITCTILVQASFYCTMKFLIFFPLRMAHGNSTTFRKSLKLISTRHESYFMKADSRFQRTSQDPKCHSHTITSLQKKAMSYVSNVINKKEQKKNIGIVSEKQRTWRKRKSF